MSIATLPSPTTTTLSPDALTEEVNGEIVEKDISTGSTWIASRIDQRLGPYVEEHKLGIVLAEAQFVLNESPSLKRRPDVAFVSAERWPLEKDPPMEGDWHLAPDLAIEVVSPNDGIESVNDKLIEYFTYGVRQAWVILPRQRLVYIYDSMDRVRLLPKDGAIESTLLPGFQLPLTMLCRIKLA
jgi:Uma2 family endonuclease